MKPKVKLPAIPPWPALCSLGGKRQPPRRGMPSERPLHMGETAPVLSPTSLHHGSSPVPALLGGCAQCVPAAFHKKSGLNCRCEAGEGTPECSQIPEDTPRVGSAALGDFSVQFCGFSSVSFASFPPPPPVFCFISTSGRGGEYKRRIKKKRGGGG